MALRRGFFIIRENTRSTTRQPNVSCYETTEGNALRNHYTSWSQGCHDFPENQIRGQLLHFKPWSRLDLKALTVRELRQIASKPYRFERSIIKKRLRDVSLTRLKPETRALVVMADIVPGGEWVVTLTVELTTLVPPSGAGCLRLWCIAAPVMKQFGCRASLALSTGFNPRELCLQPDEAEHCLLVFVNGVQGPDGERTGKGSVANQGHPVSRLMQAWRIDLSADDPQFSSLTTLPTPRPSAGMVVHGYTALATTSNPETGEREDVVWNWKHGQSVLIPSSNRLWSIAGSQDKIVFWNDAKLSVDVHEALAEGEWGLARRHEPIYHLPPQASKIMGPIAPTLVKPWNLADRHTILVHTENTTIRADFTDTVMEGFKFSRYPKDNSYMQDPNNPFSPLGTYVEVPSYFVKTVSGHLVDLAPSGRLTVYYAMTGDDHPLAGESNSYHAFANFEDRASGIHHAFICPFSGVAGTVTEQCDFYIWRMK
ncbi:hypothetical protein M407DRAFT_218644 [Tulasnella calospora MUT 4182]|uniref:Uncharacterized protein n=1 Tax=Tulasnella calospora MUT 4182 TaxID=1051891 RepID=A0A0C3LK47_9AGAM|nr:hypothetical protein M407DRAFT_218644 [Tulasnella calospora MUT 4182]